MKNIISLISILFTVSFTVLAGPKISNLPLKFDDPDSFSKIEDAARKGEFDKNKELVYKVMAVSGSDKLPKQFKSKTRVKCVTSLMRDLDYAWSDLSSEEKSKLKKMWNPCRAYDISSQDTYLGMITNLFPDLDQTYKSKKKGYHFILHYTLTGSNAVSGIKFIKQVGRVLEKSYKWINKVYGKTYKNTEPMHIVFITMDAWGFCAPLGAAGQTRDAYIALDHSMDKATHGNYKKFGKAMVRGVPAHEYFHAVQFNFDYNESLFMMESSSTWIEGVIYPMNKTYIVDSIAMPYVYRNPMWPIWYSGQDYCYATMLFQRYLHETLRSSKINAEMWDECEKVNGNNSVSAISTVLASHDISWSEAIKGYGAQNYFTRYWDYKRYKKVWPAMKTQGSHSTYGVEPTASSPVLYDMGSHYIALEPPADLDLKKGGELLIKFKPNAGVKSVASLLMERGKRNFDIFDIPTDSIDANGYYEYLASGFGKKYKKAVLMVQVRDASHNLTDHKYEYAAACPQIKLNSFVSSPATITPGQTSTLTLTFDVKGCWNSMDYPLKYKAHIKGPGKVSDQVTDLVIQAKNGVAQTQNLYFNTSYNSKEGTYKFGIQFIFGSTKKMTSKSNIEWSTVVIEKPPSAVMEEDYVEIPSTLTTK